MSDQKKKHALLFVEDNPLLLHAYQRGFEEKGIEVHIAYDGGVGLEIAKEKKPEVVLLDLSVHGIGGFEVLEEIRKDASTKDIIVIMFTVSAKDEDREKAMKLGADEYLIKSEHSLDDVIEIVLKHFDNKRKNKTE